MKKTLLLFFFFVPFFSSKIFCQDIRGGEIYYHYTGGLDYTIDIFLYTQTSIGIDHSTEVFHTGDGGIDTLTGTASNYSNDITQWLYSCSSIFPGNGVYNMYLLDSFRVANIQNINNSSTEGIGLSAILEISPNFIGNSSPVFMNSQSAIDVGGGYISHNPLAYDPDGDSLSFSLIPTTSATYSTPPGITINPINGMVQMPVAAGKYAINIQVDEWRILGGTPHIIGTTHRQMILDSSSVVGIEEISQTASMNFFPNPASSYSEITFTYPSLGSPSEIVINNIDGKEVARYSLPLWSSAQHLKLPKLAEGVYVARLISNFNYPVSNVKFVVN
jgi:hypothetical protein